MGTEQTSLLEKLASNGFLTADDRRNILAIIEDLNTETQETKNQAEQLSTRLHNRDAIIEELERALAQERFAANQRWCDLTACTPRQHHSTAFKSVMSATFN